MNAENSNAGGWEKSELRQKMNSGEIWNLMSADFRSKVRPVTKLTNNEGSGYAHENAAVTSTLDKLFQLSYSEIVETPYSGGAWSYFPWIDSEGTQYEAFKGKVTNNCSGNTCLMFGCVGEWWERSMEPDGSSSFLTVSDNGDPSYCSNLPTYSLYVCPAFCF